MGSWVISGQPIGRYALRHVLAKRKLQSGSGHFRKPLPARLEQVYVAFDAFVFS
jgi:hypothetical protein